MDVASFLMRLIPLFIQYRVERGSKAPTESALGLVSLVVETIAEANKDEKAQEVVKEKIEKGVQKGNSEGTQIQ